MVVEGMRDEFAHHFGVHIQKGKYIAKKRVMFITSRDFA